VLTFDNGIQLVDVALAHTPEQQRQGLSGQNPIEQSMLFVWPDATIRGFWMQNTHQPLRLYFLNEQARITQMLDMPPQTEQIYSSYQPTRYALEVPFALAEFLALPLETLLVAVACRQMPQ
jgi:uncharacterized membrane protein (UPF0127 family)